MSLIFTNSRNIIPTNLDPNLLMFTNLLHQIFRIILHKSTISITPLSPPNSR